MQEFHDEDEVEVHEDDGEAIWLMSLADMMTLLFTFFVVMYAAAVAENFPNGQVAQSIAETFGGEYKEPHEALKGGIEEILKENGMEGEVDIKSSLEGIAVTFSSTVLFASGSAEISTKFKGPINDIVAKVRESAPQDMIRVEGHTDDVPISSLRYPSNWELSGARASALIRLFENVGFAKDRLTAIGYGETRPLFENRTPAGAPLEENMAKNRRVVLKIMKPYGIQRKDKLDSDPNI